MNTITRDQYNRLVAAEMPEKVLQDHILRVCKRLDILAYHTYDSRRSTSPGYPDLAILVEGDPGRYLTVELKTQRGRCSTAQKRWLRALDRVPGVEVGVWRPIHWMDGTIHRVLEEGAPLEGNCDVDWA